MTTIRPFMSLSLILLLTLLLIFLGSYKLFNNNTINAIPFISHSGAHRWIRTMIKKSLHRNMSIEPSIIFGMNDTASDVSTTNLDILNITSLSTIHYQNKQIINNHTHYIVISTIIINNTNHECKNKIQYQCMLVPLVANTGIQTSNFSNEEHKQPITMKIKHHLNYTLMSSIGHSIALLSDIVILRIIQNNTTYTQSLLPKSSINSALSSYAETNKNQMYERNQKIYYNNNIDIEQQHQLVSYVIESLRIGFQQRCHKTNLSCSHCVVILEEEESIQSSSKILTLQNVISHQLQGNITQIQFIRMHQQQHISNSTDSLRYDIPVSIPISIFGTTSSIFDDATSFICILNETIYRLGGKSYGIYYDDKIVAYSADFDSTVSTSNNQSLTINDFSSNTTTYTNAANADNYMTKKISIESISLNSNEIGNPINYATPINVMNDIVSHVQSVFHKTYQVITTSILNRSNHSNPNDKHVMYTIHDSIENDIQYIRTQLYDLVNQQEEYIISNNNGGNESVVASKHRNINVILQKQLLSKKSKAFNLVDKINPVIDRLIHVLYKIQLEQWSNFYGNVLDDTIGQQIYNIYQQQYSNILRNYYGAIYEQYVDDYINHNRNVNISKSMQSKQKFILSNYRASIIHCNKPLHRLLSKIHKNFKNMPHYWFDRLYDMTNTTSIIDDFVLKLQSDMNNILELRVLDTINTNDDDYDILEKYQHNKRRQQVIKICKYIGSRCIMFGINYIQGYIAVQSIKRIAIQREREMPKFPLF